MDDFGKGIVIFILVVFTALIAIGQIARFWKYTDSWHDQQITACVAHGYEWGNCFNTIVRHMDKLTK